MRWDAIGVLKRSDKTCWILKAVFCDANGPQWGRTKSACCPGERRPCFVPDCQGEGVTSGSDLNVPCWPDGEVSHRGWNTGYRSSLIWRNQEFCFAQVKLEMFDRLAGIHTERVAE